MWILPDPFEPEDALQYLQDGISCMKLQVCDL